MFHSVNPVFGKLPLVDIAVSDSSQHREVVELRIGQAGRAGHDLMTADACPTHAEGPMAGPQQSRTNHCRYSLSTRAALYKGEGTKNSYKELVWDVQPCPPGIKCPD